MTLVGDYTYKYDEAATYYDRSGEFEYIIYLETPEWYFYIPANISVDANQLNVIGNIDAAELGSSQCYIEGWLLDDASNCGFEDIFILSGDRKIYPCTVVQREDVKSAFNADSSDLGFEVTIPESVDSFSVIIKKDGVFYTVSI